MTTIAAIISATIFFIIGSIHVYWAFGGKKDMSYLGPKLEGNRKFDPGPLSTLIVAIGLFAFAFANLYVLGWFGEIIPDTYASYIIYVIAAIFGLRAIGDFKYLGLFKKIKDTNFGVYDSRYYVPLCILLAFLNIIVASSFSG